MQRQVRADSVQRRVGKSHGQSEAPEDKRAQTQKTHESSRERQPRKRDSTKENGSAFSVGTVYRRIQMRGDARVHDRERETRVTRTRVVKWRAKVSSGVRNARQTEQRDRDTSFSQ